MIPASEVARPIRALPFWLSLTLLPLALIEAAYGGWTLLLLPLWSWSMFALLDAITGRNKQNADPETPDSALFWYRLITLIWMPLEFFLTFGLIWWVTHAGTLSGAEQMGLFFGVGIASGTIGIVYAHELLHQKPRLERWLGDLLLAMVLYSHFRSEHLLVHHRYVATPRDTVTARYNEGFHRFFARVLWRGLASSWRAERSRLARKRWTALHRANPFWRYLGLEALFVALALARGGWAGVGLFAFQALVAVWQLELTNYVEHYGLARKHLGGGKYERVLPRHSWNSSERASNWLLINLQRHSDHHQSPHRRYPLLQNIGEEQAPQLPFGYPLMTMAAMIPPLWRRRMNPRVRAWRRKFYPEIRDWKPYNEARNPMPR